jgi:hypothetical protein
MTERGTFLGSEKQSWEGPRLVPEILRLGAALVLSVATVAPAGTVVSWGHQAMPLVHPCTRFQAVAAGSDHNLALAPDGSVVAWGDNSAGACAVPGGLSGVTAIAAGGYYSLALKQDGTVVAWGYNVDGVTDVPSGLTRVIGLAGGEDHSLAVVGGNPVILGPPQTQTAEAGSTAVLSVMVDGVPPLSYQWFLASTNALSGATNSFLTLSSLQPSQSGDSYAVVITNRFGAATSDTAVLSVISPVPRRTVPMLHLTDDVGSFLHLDYADALAGSPAWQALDALTLTNSPQLYLDLTDPVRPNRFYRAWQTNAPTVGPAVDVAMATEIPLTGPIGSSVRIDYINRFGPTNAWVTLDTVMLTHSPQLYFDTTAFRHPTRLYRLAAGP